MRGMGVHQHNGLPVWRVCFQSFANTSEHVCEFRIVDPGRLMPEYFCLAAWQRLPILQSPDRAGSLVHENHLREKRLEGRIVAYDSDVREGLPQQPTRCLSGRCSA